MRSLSWNEVWGRRLARHALLAPRPKEELVEVVRDVCGIHAQMMPAAELSIGIRTSRATRQDVQAELWQRRRLVKTYGPRGTVHLFPADELPLWMAALRANPQPNEDRRLAQMGLELTQLEVIVTAIGEALYGQRLTREELGQEVARRVGSWATEAVSPAFGGRWPRWLMALGEAAIRGLLCFGPNEGQKVTFVRPDQWLGNRLTEIDGTEALREVLRRYLTTYGPATHKEFARWFGMPPARALALTRQLADELEEVDVEGHRAWLPRAGAAEAGPLSEGLVRLLPHFDCYLLGCHPRDQLVPAAWAKRVLTRGSIGNLPLVLIDGIVSGLWQQHRHGKRLEIRVEVFRPLNPGQHQDLLAAVDRVGEILETDSFLSLETVDAHPHL